MDGDFRAGADAKLRAPVAGTPADIYFCFVPGVQAGDIGLGEGGEEMVGEILAAVSVPGDDIIIADFSRLEDTFGLMGQQDFG